MINQLIQPLSDIITSLPYVDRYGGIVNTVSRLVQVGSTDEGQPIYDKEYFPISCGVTSKECWEDGRYQDLIPNENFSSVWYFEQIDGMRYEGEIRKAGGYTFYKFTEKLRLVGWLNLPKLGIEACNGSDLIVLGLVKRLNNTWKSLDDPMKIYNLDTTFVEIEPKHRNPFEKYSYNEMAEMWLYPYDYVSVIVQVDAILAEACLEDFVPGVLVECPETV